ncbi:uncharacterized protein LOC116169102 [Photinus pyralis]|uniref:uncharacterized protein LOC116169102 n=1 Tax=Photinus pyralis TaxID=7054 RepID=UPI0012676369|nr:uncharacterized protein LOC116169102 [Photinus pyralis]
MSAPGVTSSASNRRQKRMGPAPFASFEDLSDELDSPEDKHLGPSVVRLPGIREDATPCTPVPDCIYTVTGAPTPARSSTPPSTTISSLSTPQESQTSTKMSLQTPSTPRIDISRASSSSHHEDSRDSTPERELFDGHEHGSAKLGLAFKEEGALDLRSSTEELDFHDPQEKTKGHRERPQSPCYHDCQRKDSQSSEIGLLSISGRTSRLSSIGSQGSAHSRISNVSHLSIVSGQSGRSPSPHKMLLETSFCGYKSPVSLPQPVGQHEGKIDAEVLEKVLLARKHDPREAILAEGITMEKKAKMESKKSAEKVPKSSQKLNPDITITVQNPSEVDKPKLPRTFVSPSGVEYIYIPLKGPLPRDDRKGSIQRVVSASHARPTVQAKGKEAPLGKSRSKSACTSPSIQKSPSVRSNEEPKYIRIKLKPDHMYEDDDSRTDVRKPACLNLHEGSKKQFQSFTQVVSEPPAENLHSIAHAPEKPIAGASPQPTRHKVLKEPASSKTPSPSLSRRSSFTSLFKSRETVVSPDSPTVAGFKRKNTISGILKDASENIRERTRSRSKSRERDKSSVSTAPSSTESIDSAKSKPQKSVLSIFKPKKSTKSKSDSASTSPEKFPNIDAITNVEFQFDSSQSSSKKYYETPLPGESIRIPLHSPTHYEDQSILQEFKSSSQDSQETVIDTTKRVAVDIEHDTPTPTPTVSAEVSKRQNSPGSENVVFTTQLGSNNDLFTTKIPKEKQTSKTPNEIKPEINQNGIVTFLASNEKNPPAIDKSVTLNELKRVAVDDEERNKITKTESLNLTKAIVASMSEHQLSKEAVIKELTEGSKFLRNSVLGSLTNEERYSSESEKDSELDYLKAKKEEEKMEVEVVEPERKGLVLQQDSFDDELPYVPTTLPLERSVAVPIVPVKQRGSFEVRTYPIERPRSTTPINLSTLEDYCEDVVGYINTDNITKAIEKLKISLPKDDAPERVTKAKSPRKPTGGGANWFAFTDKGAKWTSPTQEGSPPPLPPKGMQKEWINFEEIPERRKPPRRIQTIPSRGTIEVPESVLQEHVVYSYVNPEDCKCECHELAREREHQTRQQEETRVQEDEVPLLEDEPIEEEKSSQEVDRIKVETTQFDRRSIISDSSLDLSTTLLEDRDFMDKLAAKVAMSIEKKLEDFKIQTEGRLNNLKKENVKLATELDELKQYSRRNNIRVFGIPETSGENVEDKFLSVTKDRMSIVLMPNEIERCHRIGKKINNKPRPVIIKFMSYKTKALLYLNDIGLD